MLIILLFAFLTAIFGGNAWAIHPCIDIEKEVSVDAGITWHDADTPDSAPETGVGQGVQYRLTVINCGDRDLETVTINDTVLGILDYPVGDLAAGDSIALDSGTIPELDQPGRCDELGEFQNTATAVGYYEVGQYTDSDPAWVKCIDNSIPCIDIEKLISVDAGASWNDADTEAEAVETEAGIGVLYQLIVTNCGNVDLTEVTINDTVLGILDYPVGDLAAGDSIALDSGTIPELDQPGRCDEPGAFENVASVEAYTTNRGTKVTDSDPAWVYCLVRGEEGCTPGYWKQPKHLEAWLDYDPSNGFFDIFGREITIRWKLKKGKPLPLTNPTLLQALQAKGGGINALVRHAVAALLNAINPDINNAYTVDEIILLTQIAIDSGSYRSTKDLFVESNEAGCPLN
jgi:hypothetical protein